jgi:hypothetical protein
MLTDCLYIYLSGHNPFATGLYPTRWQVNDRHHRLGPPSWNSNAYAIRRNFRNKTEIDINSFTIKYLEFADEGFAGRPGAECVMRGTVEQLRLRR